MTLFISHSSKDAELVKLFCDLLVDKFRIDEDDIFCTSMTNSLKVGRDFISSIRDNLQSRDAAIFFITENYKNSIFCLMEMGAAWAFKDNIIPIVIPPMDFEFFKDTPLKTIQAMRLNSSSDIMNNLYGDILCNTPGYKRLSAERESLLREHIDEFVKNVNDYTQKTFAFNIEEQKLIPIVQNGDNDAMSITESDDEYTINCDFSTNKFYPIMSSFMSCVMSFAPYKNWTNCASNGEIEFEMCSENESVDNIIVEIKAGSQRRKVLEKKLHIENTYNKYYIKLSEAQISEDALKEIAEICFVIKPNYVQNTKGTIKIKKISISKS